jgi:hypothetical protein
MSISKKKIKKFLNDNLDPFKTRGLVYEKKNIKIFK